MTQSYTGFLNFNVDNAFTFDWMNNTTGCNESLMQILPSGDVVLKRGDVNITDGDVTFSNNRLRLATDSNFAVPTLSIRGTGLAADVPRGLLTGGMVIGPTAVAQTQQYATMCNLPLLSNAVDPLDDSYYQGYKVWAVGSCNLLYYDQGNVRIGKTLTVTSNIEVNGKLLVQGTEVYENPWKPMASNVLNYDCNVTIGGRLNVGGTSTFASNVNVAGALMVQGLELKPNVPWAIVNDGLIQYSCNVSIGGVLQVQGIEMKPNFPWQIISPQLIRYTSNVDIQGSLYVKGTEIVGTWYPLDAQTIQYNSNVRIGGTLLVNGIEIKPNFPWSVMDAQTIQYNSNVNIGGRLKVQGTEIMPNFPWKVVDSQTIQYDSNVKVQGSLYVQDTELRPNYPWSVQSPQLIRYASNVEIGGNLTVQGSNVQGHWQNSNANTIQYNSNVVVRGDFSANGSTILTGNVTLSNALSVGTTLTVAGTEIKPNYPWKVISPDLIQYDSNVDIQGVLTVNGAEIKENPWVATALDTIEYASNVKVQGSLFVKGAEIIENPWKYISENTIRYDSNVEFGGDVRIDGYLVKPNYPWEFISTELIRWQSNAQIDGTLTVGGKLIQANPWVYTDASSNTISYTSNVNVGGSLTVNGAPYVATPWLRVPNSNNIIYYTSNVAIGSSNVPSPYILSVTGTSLFSANVNCQGNFLEISDARVKTDLQIISNALDKIKQLHGYTFLRTDLDTIQASSNAPFAPRRHAGMVAQEVEQVLPEVVYPDTNGFKSISYGQCVALLVEAIKALDQKVDSLIAAHYYEV